MVLVQILRRRDASSIIIAIILAIIIGQLLSMMTGDLAATLSGLKEGEAPIYNPPGAEWKQIYLFPVVSSALQIILLEILARATIMISANISKPVNHRR